MEEIVQLLRKEVEELTRLIQQQVPLGEVVTPTAWYTHDDLQRLTGYKRGTLRAIVKSGKLKMSPNAKLFYGQDVLDWLKPINENQEGGHYGAVQS
jgi:hypothetical protein